MAARVTPEVATQPGPRSVRAWLTDGSAAGDGPELLVDPDAEPAPEDGRSLERFESTGPGRAVLVDPATGVRTRILVGQRGQGPEPGSTVREIVIDGWRFEVVLESERRIALRAKARRGRTSQAPDRHRELRAVIPGRIVAIRATIGDQVVLGQPVLVLEAMKMQNEVRAPGDGRVERLPVGVGDNVEVGDLLMVIT